MPLPLWRRVVGWLMLIVAVALAATLIACWAVAARMQDLPSLSTGSPGEGTTFAVLGSDSRENLPPQLQRQLGSAEAGGARADVVLLVRTGADGGPVTVSVARDLIVSDDAGNPRRLALMLRDGPDSVARALCRSLDVGVDHVLVVSVEGLVDVVDALGGLPVTLPHALRDDEAHLDLPAGSQLLDGVTTLGLARSRHPQELIEGRWVAASVVDGSVARATRSGQLFTGIAERFRDASLPAQGRAVWAGAGHVATDADLPELMSLARAAGDPVTLPLRGVGDFFAANETTATELDRLGLSGCEAR